MSAARSAGKPLLRSGDIAVRRYRTLPDGTRELLPALRCPGGPRFSAAAIKALYRVPNCGHLAKYDWRFITNLNTTHILVNKMLNRTKAVDKLYIELGPGPGMLTRSLLTLPSLGVFGIELDTKYNTSLDEIRVHSRGRFQWANADVKDIDEAALLERHCPQVTEWLAETGEATTFLEMREKLAATRERCKKKTTTSSTVDDDELDEMLDADQDPFKHTSSTSPFAEDLMPRGNNRAEGSAGADDDDDAASSSTTPADRAGGKISCEASSSLWKGTPKLEVIGNLPFDIAAEMTMRYCVDCSRRENLFKYGRVPFHLFFQKEVAERLIAVPGSANFGRITVLAQNYFSVQLKRTFLEKTYYPSTEVLGALVTLEPRVSPVVDVDGAVLNNFCNVVLAPRKRTKSIFAALKRCMPEEVALYMLSELRVDGSVLATEVSAVEIARMALMWVRYLEATSQQPEEDGQRQEMHFSSPPDAEDKNNNSSNNDAAAQQEDEDDSDGEEPKSNKRRSAPDFQTYW